MSYVLIGGLAEALHGSPLLPITGTIRIVPQAGQREPLTAAVAAAGGKPVASPASPAINAPARFAIEDHGIELVVEPASPGTHGYNDLCRDAAAIPLDQEIEVTVASLVDLIRIIETSEDRARVHALRRTLDLASLPPAARAA